MVTSLGHGSCIAYSAAARDSLDTVELCRKRTTLWVVDCLQFGAGIQEWMLEVSVLVTRVLRVRLALNFHR